MEKFDLQGYNLPSTSAQEQIKHSEETSGEMQNDFETNWKIERVEQSSDSNSCQIEEVDADINFPSKRRQALPMIDGVLNETGGINNLAFEEEALGSRNVTQLGNNHYLIRRRATKIFVKGFPNAEVDAEINENFEEAFEEKMDPHNTRTVHSTTSLLSGMYGVIVFMLAMVIKTAQFITNDIGTTEIECFFIALYAIAVIWLIAYQPLATSCYRQKERISFAKSSHVNNRWLKGVLLLFGLAIIIKDGLEFIALLYMPKNECKDYEIIIASTLLHAVFIVLQVNYLFKHSKVFTQDFQILTRFGAMHVVATNLSKWMEIIIDETENALARYQVDSVQVSPLHPLNLNHPSNINYQVNSELSNQSKHHIDTYEDMSKYGVSKFAGFEGGIEFTENCSCTTTFCDAVGTAELFLFPFSIEFSLVASCLLYITWRHVGHAPPICQHVIKPSYKLYRSYKGTLAGALALFATILIVVILGTSHTEETPSDRTYFSEIDFLNIYNIYWISLEGLMIMATALGFYLFQRIQHNVKSESEDLDAALLIVCLIGPLIYGLFSFLAITLGKDNKDSMWIFSLLYPIFDVLQCFTQVVFLLKGLKREPKPTIEGEKTAADIHKSMELAKAYTVSPENEVEENDQKIVENEDSGRVRTSSMSSNSARDRNAGSRRPAALYAATLAKFPSSSSNLPHLRQVAEENVKMTNFSVIDTSNSEVTNICDNQWEENTSDHTEINNNNNAISNAYNNSGRFSAHNQPVMAIVKPQRGEEDITKASGQTRFCISDESSPEDRVQEVDGNEALASVAAPQAKKTQTRRKSFAFYRNPQPAVKIVAETRVSTPNRPRLLLRNVVMFLLISNACFWVFSSLDGIAFVVYMYQGHYYGNDVWTVIAMITRPFSIFFRMHSTACLFEVWSFS